MRRFIFILLLAVVIMYSGFSCVWAQSPAKRLYICLDNSSSLKDKRFYENVTTQLKEFYDRLKDRYNPLTIVLFGDSNSVLQFEMTSARDIDWINLFKTMEKTTYHTTDFVTLLSSGVFRKCTPKDRIIILSDGEHDAETYKSFSHFTEQEIKNLSNALNFVDERKQIFSIHLLHNKKYFSAAERSFTELQYTTVVTNPLHIAGLSKFIMKQLSGTRKRRYFLCNSNENAFDVLFKLLGLGAPIKPPKIIRQIDLYVHFNEMPAEFETYVKNYFRNLLYCIQGEERKVTVLKEPDDRADLKLEIINAGEGTVDVNLNGRTIWRGTEVDFYDKDTKFLGDLKSRMKKNLLGLDKFKIPEGYVNVFIPDSHVYAFIEAGQYQVKGEKKGCPPSGRKVNVYQEAAVSLQHFANKGFLIKGPTSLTSIEFYLQYESDSPGNNLKHLFNAAVKPEHFRYLSQMIKPSLNLPDKVSISFQDVFQRNPGELYIYAHTGDSFVKKLTAKNPTFQFFKDFGYTFYYVPKESRYSIVKETRKISNFFDSSGNKTGRYHTLMTMLANKSQLKSFDTWKSCLDSFDSAQDQNAIVREILISDIFFELFFHLDKVNKDKNYKSIFLKLLEKITGTPFDYTPFPTAKLYKDVYNTTDSNSLLQNRIPISDRDKIRLIAESLGDFEAFFKNGILYLDEAQDKDSVDEKWSDVYNQLLEKKKR